MNIEAGHINIEWPETVQFPEVKDARQKRRGKCGTKKNVIGKNVRGHEVRKGHLSDLHLRDKEKLDEVS